MKLKTFNSENTVSFRKNLPLLSVYVKTGILTFNKTAAELIGLKHDTEIQVHQDEDEPENFFIEIVSSNGFKIRLSEKGEAPQYNFNSTSLARSMTNDGELNGKFIIAGQATKIEKKKLFGLLRRLAK